MNLDQMKSDYCPARTLIINTFGYLFKRKQGLRLLAALVVAFLASGCPRGYTPYSAFSTINENGIPQAAQIQFSDPLVFSRESLINDRVEDRQFYNELLKTSNSVSFEPQALRDLNTISAMATQFGISFDPAVKLQFERSNELGAIQQEIALTRLRAELIGVQRQLEAVQAGTVQAPQGSGAPPTAPTGSVNGASVKEMQDLLRSTLTTLNAAAGQAVRPSSLSSSPEDRLKDMKAYRAELRNASAAASLDDSHDMNGNGLYRLQFRVTVYPGDERDRWGFARLKITPPELPQSDTQALPLLYSGWLDHLNGNRLNASSNGKMPDIKKYQALSDLGLFTLKKYPAALREKDALKAKRLCPDEAAASDRPKDCTIIYLAEPPAELPEGAVIQDQTPKKQFSYTTQQALEVFQRRSLRSEDFKQGVQQAVQPRIKSSSEDKRINVPPKFIELITSTWNATKATGTSFVYETTPGTRDQRVSTVASAAHSFQLALALSANLPGKGIGLNSGLGYLKDAIGKMEMIERTPLVLGLSDRYQAVTDQKDSEQAWFGWVIGPQVRVDAEANQMKFLHSIARHEVAADIAIPAWWPWVELEQESIWLGSWKDSDRLKNGFTPSTTKQFRVYFTPNVASFDALTKLALASYGFPPSQLLIEKVIPDTISACAQQLTFSIRGQNLWRNPEVYFNGLRHSDLRVHPDMGGLVVTFDMAGVQKWGRIPEQIMLEVVTSALALTNPIKVEDIKPGGCKNDDAKPAKANIREKKQ